MSKLLRIERPQLLVNILVFLALCTSVNIPTIFYLSAIVLIVFGLSLFTLRKIKWNFTIEDKLFIFALMIYSFAAAINMIYHDHWMWSQFSAPSKFVLVLPIFFLVKTYGISTRWLYFGLVVGLIFAGSYAFFQHEIEGIDRVYGGTSGQLSGFGLIVLLMTFFLLVLKPQLELNSLIARLLPNVAIVFGTYAVIYTGTKGVWIAALPLILFIIFSSSLTSIGKKLIWLAISLISLFAIYLSVDLVQTRINDIISPTLQYFSNGSVTDGSASVRLETWRAALIMFSDNPIMGTGLGNFVQAKQSLIESGLILPESGFVAGPHNDIVGILAIQGLLGLGALLFLVISFVRLCNKGARASTAMSSLGYILIIGYFFSGMAGDRLSINITVTFLAVMMSVIAGQISGIRQSHME